MDKTLLLIAVFAILFVTMVPQVAISPGNCSDSQCKGPNPGCGKYCGGPPVTIETRLAHVSNQKEKGDIVRGGGVCTRICTPSQVQTQSCNYCSGQQYCNGGTQARTCSGDGCSWGGWTACTGGSCSLVSGQCGNVNNCGNGFCEASETQASCPSDCYTSVSINPNVGATGGQLVTVMIAFNDSRYVAGHNANYQLTIDGVTWDSTNGCSIAGVNATPTANGMNGGCAWKRMMGGGMMEEMNASCTSTSVNGYLKLVTQCNLPYNLVGGNHVFQATPTFYSNPTTLNSGLIVFQVGQAGSVMTGDAAGVTLNQAVAKFTTAQTTGTMQMLNDFFNWLMSLPH